MPLCFKRSFPLHVAQDSSKGTCLSTSSLVLPLLVLRYIRGPGDARDGAVLIVCKLAALDRVPSTPFCCPLTAFTLITPVGITLTSCRGRQIVLLPRGASMCKVCPLSCGVCCRDTSSARPCCRTDLGTESTSSSSSKPLSATASSILFVLQNRTRCIMMALR